MKTRGDKKANATFQKNHQRGAWGSLINFIVVMCYKMQIAEKGQYFVNKYVS